MIRSSYAGVLCVFLAGITVAQRREQEDWFHCRMVTSADLADAKAPTFKAYPAAIRPIGTIATLNLKSNPIAPRYRTRLREEIVEGPNYAGHYRVAIWGCGTSCAMFAVVNLKTGRVITASGATTVTGVYLGADDFLPNTKSDGWGFRFRRDSKLLVLVGELEEDEAREGAFYYVLKNERLIPIHSTVVKKTCPDR